MTNDETHVLALSKEGKDRRRFLKKLAAGAVAGAVISGAAVILMPNRAEACISGGYQEPPEPPPKPSKPPRPPKPPKPPKPKPPKHHKP